MAFLHSKACLLLILLSQAGLFIIVLTIVSRNVAHYTLAGAVDDVFLPPSSAFDWNNSTSWNRGLRYISVRELDRLLHLQGSSGAASEVNLQMMSTYDGKAEDEHKHASSFNCSSAAAGAANRKLSPWCTIRRYPDTVDVELLSKSNLLSTEVRSSMHCNVLFQSFNLIVVEDTDLYAMYKVRARNFGWFLIPDTFIFFLPD